MRRTLSVCTAALLAGGCFLDSSVGGSPDVDGGDPTIDTGVVSMDASTDAGPRPDAADVDAFVPPGDDGGVDAFVPPTPDAGVDAGMDSCVPTGLTECTTAGLDDNCNGEVDEGCACFGTMTGTCTVTGGCEGTRVCNGAGAWGPCVVPPGLETCNGIDDDCDGVRDQGATCATTGCGVFHRDDGHVYLFCRMGDRNHTNARAFCQGLGGYDLATIETEAEDDALQAAANAYPSDRYWIGLRMGSWVSGSGATYRGGGVGGSECAVLDSGDNDWGGDGCGTNNAFLCEAPPL